MLLVKRFALFSRTSGCNNRARQTLGQSAWNAAIHVDHTIIGLSDTAVDPRYTETHIPAFIAMLRLRWKEDSLNDFQ